jgi:hypothetical protein
MPSCDLTGCPDGGRIKKILADAFLLDLRYIDKEK